MKKLYLRWLYNKVFKSEPSDLVSILKHYLHVTRTLSFNNAAYMVRRGYVMKVKTDNFEQFCKLSDKVLSLLEIEVNGLSIITERHAKRKAIDLDLWLVNSERKPYDEKEAARLTLKYAQDILGMLLKLEKKSPAVAHYHTQSSRFYLLELIEILDTLTALELGVVNGRRYGQTLVAG